MAKPKPKPKPKVTPKVASSPIPPQILAAAKAEGGVKYGPEFDALANLAQQSRDTYEQAANNARAGASYVQNAAEQSMKTYAPLLGDPGVTTGAPPRTPGAETDAFLKALGMTKEGTLGQLALEGPRAQAGANYQQSTAQRTRDQALGQIGKQRFSLHGQKADYVASQIAAQLAAAGANDAAQKAATTKYLRDRALADAKAKADAAKAAAGNVSAETIAQGHDVTQTGIAQTKAANTAVKDQAKADAKARADQAKRDAKARANANKFGAQAKQLSNRYIGQINQIASLLPALEHKTIYVNSVTGQRVQPAADGTVPDKDANGNPITPRRLTAAEINQVIPTLTKSRQAPAGVNTAIFIHAARELHEHGFITAGTAGALKRRYKIVLPAGMVQASHPVSQSNPSGVAKHGGFG